MSYSRDPKANIPFSILSYKTKQEIMNDLLSTLKDGYITLADGCGDITTFLSSDISSINISIEADENKYQRFKYALEEYNKQF
jgi:hypothetical protein